MRISDWSSDVCSSDLPHEVDTGAEIERADDGRAGEDQDRQRLVGVGQGMGDLAAAPQMPQAEAVVAVNEDTLAPAAVLHAGSLSSHCGDYGTGQGAAERPSRARPGGPGDRKSVV